jgi:hypothetical protein
MEIVLVKSGIRDKLLSRRATAPGGCRVMRLNGGDELEAQIYSSATSSTTIDTSVVWNWLTVRSIQ